MTKLQEEQENYVIHAFDDIKLADTTYDDIKYAKEKLNDGTYKWINTQNEIVDSAIERLLTELEHGKILTPCDRKDIAIFFLSLKETDKSF